MNVIYDSITEDKSYAKFRDAHGAHVFISSKITLQKVTIEVITLLKAEFIHIRFVWIFLC